MKTKTFALGMALVCAAVSTCAYSRPPKKHTTEQHYYTAVNSYDDIKAFFKYDADRDVLVSGHRGGMVTGYPENCIESCEKTLTMMPSFFEIDPRLTKDSVIVLMHDATIDRTTTGKGKVGDYTYAELQNVNLVDRKGNITLYKIPKLSDCVEWSQGKTVLNLDIKDVPTKIITDFVKSTGKNNIIYTVWRPDQVLEYLENDPDAKFSIWCRKPKEFDAYNEAGIPWERVMIAYVGGTMEPKFKAMYDGLHKKGVVCMISTAPTHDRCYNDSCKVAGYKYELNTATRPDVVETDYPYLILQAK
jgi:glycerophosphoryl diester phosphodiesterase